MIPQIKLTEQLHLGIFSSSCHTIAGGKGSRRNKVGGRICQDYVYGRQKYMSTLPNDKIHYLRRINKGNIKQVIIVLWYIKVYVNAYTKQK